MDFIKNHKKTFIAMVGLFIAFCGIDSYRIMGVLDLKLELISFAVAAVWYMMWEFASSLR